MRARADSRPQAMGEESGRERAAPGLVSRTHGHGSLQAQAAMAASERRWERTWYRGATHSDVPRAIGRARGHRARRRGAQCLRGRAAALQVDRLTRTDGGGAGNGCRVLERRNRLQILVCSSHGTREPGEGHCGECERCSAAAMAALPVRRWSCGGAASMNSSRSHRVPTGTTTSV